MWMLGALLSMGLNQTLLFSFLPYVADVLGISGSSLEWSGVIILLNANLLSYFIGSIYWPNKITSDGFAVSARLAFAGYALVSVIFIVVLMLLSFDLSWHWLSLIILGATRFAMGYFSSAFLPIAHGYILAQNHDHASQYKQLSRASSALTLGRLIGPGLALIPINWLLILVVPLLPMLWSYFQCPSTDNNRQDHKSQVLPVMQRLKLAPIWTLICALLTTAWVASFQLALAPEVHRLIPTPAEASHQLAMFLLGVSIVALFGQAVLMPLLAKFIRVRISLMVLGLLVFTVLIISKPATYPVFVMAGVGLALAVSALPTWYSQVTYHNADERISKVSVSGLIAQSHSIGHLLGTGATALFLSLGVNALHASALFALLLLISMCAIGSTSLSPSTMSISEK